MTVQEQLNAIKVGDKLEVRLGFEHPPESRPSKLGTVACCIDREGDQFLLISFPEGLIVANAWHSEYPDEDLYGKATINPANFHDVPVDDLALHEIHQEQMAIETYEGGLFEIVSINGKQIVYEESI